MIFYWLGLFYLIIIVFFGVWLFYLKFVERIGGVKSGYMVVFFLVIVGVVFVVIGEFNLFVYFLIGCICSCLGVGIVFGLGLYLFKIVLKINKFVNK